MTNPDDKTLLVFDFDDTVIEGNSDLEVKALHPIPIPDHIKRIGSTNHGWIEYKNALFASLHALGINVEDIKSKVLALPLVPGMEELFQFLRYEESYEVVMMSGANTLFIEWYLQDRSLEDLVTHVYSNYAEIRAGRLVVRCHHHQDWCNMCSKNLCKGQVLDSYIKDKQDAGVTYSKICYVGDGRNDFCPTLKLTANDYVFPRKDFVLHDRIIEESSKVKANVVPWKCGVEIMDTLKNIN